MNYEYFYVFVGISGGDFDVLFDMRTLVGVLLFTFAWCCQLHTAYVFANLRKNTKGKIIYRTGFKNDGRKKSKINQKQKRVFFNLIFLNFR